MSISAWANQVFLLFWEHSFRFTRFHFMGPQVMRNGVLPAISVDQDDTVLRVCSRTGNPLQYSCLENPRDGGVWWAAVHGVAHSQTRLSHVTFPFHLHALEMEMATHPRVLAWRIPGTGKPDGLLSMGSHRVGHDWSDLAGCSGRRNILLVWQLPDCCHSLRWTQGSSGYEKMQGAWSQDRWDAWKEWFQWAQTLASSHI